MVGGLAMSIVVTTAVLLDATGTNSADKGANQAVTVGGSAVFESLALGGSSDAWSPTRAWTPALVNAAEFGFQLKWTIDASGGEVTLLVDFVTVTVYYTVPESGGVVLSQRREVAVFRSGWRPGWSPGRLG
jgi:hypothetical protein